MAITTHQLLQSYHQSLVAKVQQIEFQSWGGVIGEHCRKTIADHQELEDRFVAEMIERRAQQAEEFKKLLERR